jgi:hypothetical protein
VEWLSASRTLLDEVLPRFDASECTTSGSPLARMSFWWE